MSTAYAGQARVLFTSIRPLTTDDAVQAVRAVDAPDLSERMAITLSLDLRNGDELRARVARGENQANGKLTAVELDATYLPSVEDYQKVLAWLSAEGFTILQTDPDRTLVSAEGPAALVGQALSVDFAKVTTADGEFTSAINAPTLPAALPDSVLAIDGLQPHVRAHHRDRRARRATLTAGGGLFFGPADIRSAYGATSAMTGAGQTIAIINDAYPVTTDLTTFWTQVGTAQTTANVTDVPINGGPSNPDSGDVEETNLDVAYSGAMAPGAQIRVYGMRSLTFGNTAVALAQIRTDHATNSAISVVSMSFGSEEDALSLGAVNSTSNQLTMLAAAGISCVSSSGDEGSRPDPALINFGYQRDAAKSAGYPASDPNCTGVGGTTLTFTGTSGTTLNYGSETTWSEIPANPTATSTDYGASGGGVSVYFTKPSWQADGNAFLAAQTMRCVPDIVAMSNGVLPNGHTDYVEIYVNGSPEAVEGTSLSSPIWAGITAIVNQARATASESSIGLLNAALYPLAGSGAFHDITTGNNGGDYNSATQVYTPGDYSATVGYDLTTGLGTPILPTLVAALAGVVPTITNSPTSVSVQEGTATSFSVGAGGSPAPSYAWQREASGSASFVAMTDTSAVYSGSATATLTILSPTVAMSGDQFRCVVTNLLGSATSNAATLTVTPKPAAVSSGGGGGGGGGAVSGYFLAALAGLIGARLLRRGPRPRAA